ncbi:hypothetical protein C1J02_12565 [Sulfitobacter sp. SK011]|nr:hypothetical protein C1J02_12565 [Sulfitobacter sp. SK011]
MGVKRCLLPREQCRFWINDPRIFRVLRRADVPKITRGAKTRSDRFPAFGRCLRSVLRDPRGTSDPFEGGVLRTDRASLFVCVQKE